MAETTIEWTATRLPDGSMLPGFTFNPWVGCTKVSDACTFCYAKLWVERFGGDFSQRHRTTAQNWRKPLKWNKDAAASGIRRKVFCASLADVFDNQVPENWRTDLFNLIWHTQNLDWLLLTKRPQNIRKMIETSSFLGLPANVWLGTTVENQEEANRRIPHLLSVPATVHFLSCEPLLSSIDLSPWLKSDNIKDSARPQSIDLVIAGGESGPGRRPMDLAWMRSIRDQCAAAGVAFFGKQLDKVRDLPPDLMVRQFPEVRDVR